MNPPSLRRTRPLGFLLLLALAIAGCIKGDVYDYVAYDAASDSFKFLQLDLNIAADNAADLDYLAARYKQRDQIITYPAPIRFFGLPALLRIDATHFQQIDLTQAPSKEPPQVTTTIRLDTIKIEPGGFFLGPGADHNLACYHQVIVSGKQLDEALATVCKQLDKALADEGIAKERKRRRAGGKHASWEKLRQELAEDFAEYNKPAGAPAANKPARKPDADQDSGWWFDDVSLDLLAKSASAGELGVQRQGGEFRLALPLSAEDCRQAQETLQLVWKGVAEHRKSLGQADDVCTLLPDARSEITADNHLVIVLAVKSCIGFSPTSYTEAKADPKLADKYRATVAGLEPRGVPIDRQLTVEKVLADFAGQAK